MYMLLDYLIYSFNLIDNSTSTSSHHNTVDFFVHPVNCFDAVMNHLYIHKH